MTKIIVLIFLTGALLVFINLGSVPVFDVDEAVFAQASKEMFLSKDWINPTYNGINRYDKPILIYWLMVGCYLVFGVNEFSARLPSAIAGLCLAFTMYLFAKRFFLKERAFYGLIPLFFSPYFFIYSRAAVTDMTLTLFITLSLFSFYINRGILSSVGFHLFVALAFLTKGLIGIVFPYAICLLFIAITKSWQRLKIITNPFGLVFFLMVSMPWYLAQYSRNGMEFVEQFFLKHHFQRYTDVISGHKGPFYYYLLSILLGLIPWSLLLISGIKKAWKQREEIMIFLTVWLFFVVGFFSLSTTKLPNYILPCLPAGVLLIASSFEELNSRWFKYIIIISASILSIMSFSAPSIANRYVSFDMDWLYLIGVVNILTVSLFVIKNREFCHLSLRSICLTVGMALIFLIIAIKGLPSAGNYIQGDVKQFSHYIKANTSDDERIIFYKINKPSILFYSDRKIYWVGNVEDAQRILRLSTERYLISKNTFETEILQLGFRVVMKGREYALFQR